MEKENNSKTDRKRLIKGAKYLAGSLILAFAGPSIIFSAGGNKDKALFIPVLVFGLLFTVGAAYFIYKGIKTIMHALFND